MSHGLILSTVWGSVEGQGDGEVESGSDEAVVESWREDRGVGSQRQRI